MGLVVHTSAFTAHRSVILGKLWFVGNFNSNIGKREHSWVWGWGIRYPCDWRARSLGSKRPNGIYSRRDVLLDQISGYVGKTLVKGVRDPVGLVVHTSAFTAHRSVILGKLWFVENFISNIGKREHSWVLGWGIRHPCH